MNRIVVRTAAGIAAFALCIVTLSAGGRPHVQEGRDSAQSEEDRPDVSGFYREMDAIRLDAVKARGIAVGPENRIYCSADESILIFEPSGALRTRFPVEEPAGCLAVGADGLLYLGMQDHVQVFTEAGRRLAIWAGLGREALITSLAAEGDQVLVADAGNRMVLRFDKGGRLLQFVAGGDAQGPQLMIPSAYFDLAPAADGSLWVVNPGEHRILRLTGDGALLLSWGASGQRLEDFCGCCNPTHIAVSPTGTLLTSEKGIARVKEYDGSGRLLALVAGPVQFAEGTRGLDLAVDGRGRVLVLDPEAGAVRIFVREGP